jgi:7-cyano-7-deazaguanine reductase
MNPKFLGKKTNNYSKGSFKSLDPIQRKISYSKYGLDFWNAYEFNYLDKYNIPILKLLEIRIPSNSRITIESKSLKIYLNSFYNKTFNNEAEILKIVKKDLENIIKSSVKLRFIKKFNNEPKCIEINKTRLIMAPANKPLKFTGFRSICPVTSQPDFANIYVLCNKKLDVSFLCDLLISFKETGEFHEQCVENIFKILNEKYECSSLEVMGRFMRRGGIDINPLRSSNKKLFFNNFRFFNQ